MEGFLVRLDLTKAFREEEKADRLLTRYQSFDRDTMEAELRQAKDRQEELTMLKKKYPCLYVFALKALGRERECNEYMDKCKKYKKKKPEHYYIYVHGYFLPWLHEQRTKGLLKMGKSAKYGKDYLSFTKSLFVTQK